MSAAQPTRDQLRAYLLGRVTPGEQGAISLYLDAHPELLDQMTEADTSDDSLLVELRHSAAGFMREAEFLQGLKAISQTGTASLPAGVIPESSGAMGMVGPYRLVERINRRGLSVVWRATDTRDGTPAAIKLLPVQRLNDPDALARFRREMALVANLNHPNIVRCLGSGETDGVPYLAMELLEGCDLSDLVRRQGALSIGAACAIVSQAANALEYVHNQQMVHRDVKPSNLFLTTKGVVKLLDLGLALNLVGDDDSLTHSDQLLGTMDYMAPEQAFDSGQADSRSDIYSLGCTLYKLLVGKAPFVGGDYQNVLRKALAHASRPMPDPRASRPDMPEALAALVRRMCAKEPTERPESAGKIARALADWAMKSDLAELPSLAKGPDKRPQSPNTIAASWLLLAAIFVSVTAAALFIPSTSPHKGHGLKATTILQNGDFEERLVGWAPQAPNRAEKLGLFQPSMEKAFRGTASAKAEAVSDFSKTGYAWISAPFSLEQNRRYVLSASFEASEMKSGTLAVDLAEAAGPFRINSRPGYEGWQHLWAEFEGWDGSANVRLIHDCDGTKGECGYIDAVAVIPLEDFRPNPSILSIPANAQPEQGSISILQPGPKGSPMICLHVSEKENRIMAIDMDGDAVVNQIRGDAIEIHSGTDKLRSNAAQAASFHPHGTHAAMILHNGQVVIREVASNKSHHELVIPGKGSCLAWSPDGSKLVVVNATGNGRMFGFPDLKPLVSFGSSGHRPTGLAWSPDGKSLAVAAGSHLHILDPESGEIRAQNTRPELVFTCLAWAYDNMRLFAGTVDGKITVWNMKLESPLETVSAHNGRVNCLAVSAEGTRLASGGEDNRAIIWQSAPLKQVARASGYKTSVRALAFASHPKNILYFSTQNGLVMRWDMDPASKMIGGTP